MDSKLDFIMKQFLLIFLFSFSVSLFAQGEANVWYFGNNAGLDFGTGAPVAVNNGQLNTTEGCSSIADTSGNLLFYTDGITVYNKNHQVMQNGNNLGGNPSSSQSGLIVPSPNSPNIYFLFTVGTNAVGSGGLPQNAGFKYYTIDMTANASLGTVLSSFVNLSGALSNQWSEKVTAVDADNCDSIWVISLVNNTFYSFLIDASGVSTTPVISTVPNNSSDVRGYLKVSPNGTKLVAANMTNGTFLYDFDTNTGMVSNENRLNLNFANGYGVEFSLDSKKLYVATGNFTSGSTENLYQFNLDLANFNLIDNSRYLVKTYANSRGALQLAPNGKIYWASHQNTFISVINNPENLGIAVNYEHLTVSLGGQRSTQGLPPFIQSLFLPNINIVDGNTTTVTTQLDLCDGDNYTLEPYDISAYPATTTYNWLLNDLPLSPAVTTSFLDIIGTASGTNNYTLEIDFNDGTSCPFIGKAEVNNHANPNLTPITIRQCDDDNTDGYTAIDLTLANTSILTTPIVDEVFTYFETQAFAQNGSIANAITNPTNYNTNTKSIWVRVETPFCFSVIQVDLIVSVANATFTENLYKCDDFINGTSTDVDGITAFDLSQIEINPLLINQFAIAVQPNLNFSYYTSIADAQLQTNAILNPNSYRNTTTNTTITPERIYIRINNNTNLDCAGLGSDTNLFIDLVVETLPIANSINNLQELRGCDDDHDSFYLFDTSNLENTILSGQSNVTLTYYYLDTTTNTQVQIPTAQIIPSFLTETKTITVRATNNLTNDPNGACFNETEIDFIVDIMPIANPVAPLIMCDDKPDETDGMSKFDTSIVESTILLGQTNVTVSYYDTNNILLPSPLPNPFETSTQTIIAKLTSTINTTCVATTNILFEVKLDNPVFAVFDQLLCTNTLPTPLTVTIGNPQDVYDYFWENDKGEQIGTNTDSIQITEGGEYTVTATTTASVCSVTKTFFVTESSIPQIETINIFDDSPNNRVSVLVSGNGDYEFALDNGAFVDANEEFGHVFYNVLEGGHTIHVRDKNGCLPVVSKDIAVIRFPRFITPNNDAINDHFYVIGSAAFAKSSVYIMDRYGKVIADISNNTSWDGTYLGKKVPNDDYWFYAEFFDVDGKKYERQGHFSLKY